MSIYINEEMMEPDDMEVDGPLEDIGTDDEEVDKISENIEFEWQRPKYQSGRERYLALCKKMGITP